MREKRFTRNAIHNNDRLFLLEIFEWKGLGVPHIWWCVAHENDARNCFLSWCNDIQRNNVSKWKFHRRERRKILKLQQPLLNNVCVHCTKFARMERFSPARRSSSPVGFFPAHFIDRQISRLNSSRSWRRRSLLTMSHSFEWILKFSFLFSISFFLASFGKQVWLDSEIHCSLIICRFIYFACLVSFLLCNARTSHTRFNQAEASERVVINVNTLNNLLFVFRVAWLCWNFLNSMPLLKVHSQTISLSISFSSFENSVSHLGFLVFIWL